MYRAYDAKHGRWLNRDPIGERGGLNLYAYVKGSPVNRIDRSGRDGEAVDSGFWSSLSAAAAGAATRLGSALDGILGSGAVYGGSGVAVGSGGVAIGILGGGVFISEGKDDPTADAEGPDEGGVCGDDLPSLDGTGKVHGDLPQPGDFGQYSDDELEQLRDELVQSVETRIQKTVDLGSDFGHGERQAAEQQLIRQIDKYLSGS